ncbi:MAG TPA: hypothetical protein PLH39_13090, partial [Promineifilum sp.]|nr:hypothetical protein [Promineifilum sp.]
MDKNHHSSDSEGDINVGDLLRLALPLDTSLVGNNAEPRRYVNWVAVLTDWANVEEQVQPNDLVLIPTTLQRRLTGADAADLLRPLAELPAAALLFFEPIAAELEKALNELKLTALVASAKSSLRDTHESVAQLLVDRQTATSERALQLYRQLSTMSREGLGLQAMTEVMSKLTGNTVAVQDKRLEVQAISWGNM